MTQYENHRCCLINEISQGCKPFSFTFFWGSATVYGGALTRVTDTPKCNRTIISSTSFTCAFLLQLIWRSVTFLPDFILFSIVPPELFFSFLVQQKTLWFKLRKEITLILVMLIKMNENHLKFIQLALHFSLNYIFSFISTVYFYIFIFFSLWDNLSLLRLWQLICVIYAMLFYKKKYFHTEQLKTQKVKTLFKTAI